jgi:hypothetical protein
MLDEPVKAIYLHAKKKRMLQPWNATDSSQRQYVRPSFKTYQIKYLSFQYLIQPTRFYYEGNERQH